MSAKIMIVAALLVSRAAWGAAPASPYVDVILDQGHVAVGTIRVGCAHVLDKNRKPAQTPQGFAVSPDQALHLAIRARALHCADKTFVKGLVSTDTAKFIYSILSYRIVNGRPERHVVHVDGRSGKVTKVR